MKEEEESPLCSNAAGPVGIGAVVVLDKSGIERGCAEVVRHRGGLSAIPGGVGGAVGNEGPRRKGEGDEADAVMATLEFAKVLGGGEDVDAEGLRGHEETEFPIFAEELGVILLEFAPGAGGDVRRGEDRIVEGPRRIEAGDRFDVGRSGGPGLDEGRRRGSVGPPVEADVVMAPGLGDVLGSRRKRGTGRKATDRAPNLVDGRPDDFERTLTPERPQELVDVLGFRRRTR